MSISLELGKSYITRCGLTTSPLTQAKNGTSYIYEAEIVGDSSIFSWTKDGEFFFPGYEHPRDLVMVAIK